MTNVEDLLYVRRTIGFKDAHIDARLDKLIREELRRNPTSTLTRVASLVKRAMGIVP